MITAEITALALAKQYGFEHGVKECDGEIEQSLPKSTSLNIPTSDADGR
jgi:hypothetical protein